MELTGEDYIAYMHQTILPVMETNLISSAGILANQGATWSNAVKVNDDASTQNNHQWHPAIWCDKTTGRLYVQWMDTRDTPTHDSAYIYASYSDNGGASFVANQADFE